MYIDTSSSNHGNGIFVSFERTDTVHFTNIAFYYNRFSSLSKDLLKTMGCFRIQLLLADKTWSTRYNLHKNIDRLSHHPTVPNSVYFLLLKFMVSK